MSHPAETDRRLGALGVAVLVLVGSVVAPDARTAQATEVVAVSRPSHAGLRSDHREHPSLGTVQRPPDSVGRDRGGIAARIRRDDTPLPGDVFMLMGVEGSDATAVLYDGTPFEHDRGPAPDSRESNVDAAALAAELLGREIEPVELTTAPGGGSSGGLAYVLSYLDLATEGGFTAGLRVGATGALEPYGYIHPVLAVDEKAAAADLANVDVVFVPSRPRASGPSELGRIVGETERARFTGADLAEERLLDRYRAWGTERPDSMDVVVVRHVADVAAYLCGAGSTAACDMAAVLADRVVGPAAAARSSAPEPDPDLLPPALPAIR